MKTKLLFSVLMTVPVIAMAANFDDEVNAELEKMYQQSKTKPSSSGRPGTAVQVNVTQSPEQSLSSQSFTQQAQKQPTTVIEASPLTDSKADRIRRARQETEIQTEQKIVEKLEMSRIEDERRRAEVLFGDRFSQLANPAVQSAAPAPASPAPVAAPAPVVSPVPVATPAPVQTAVPPQVIFVQQVTPTPAPVAVVPEPVPAVKEVAPAPVAGLDKEDVRAEISAALADMKAKEEKPKDKMYFAGLLGMSDYPDANNLKGNYAAGFSVGKVFPNQFHLEGAFTYSSYQVQQSCTYSACPGGFVNGVYYPTITQMDQYQGSLVGKYQVFSGQLRPVIGGAIAYTYRSFSDTQFARYNSDATSQAVDLGFVTGADIVVTETFSIGLDYRYYMNMNSQTSSQFQRSINPQEPGKKPVEQLNYYTLGIVGRTSF